MRAGMEAAAARVQANFSRATRGGPPASSRRKRRAPTPMGLNAHPIRGIRQQQRSRRSACTSSNDYSLNDGVVEGVWMFCRHGDRTPSRCMSPQHRSNDEAAFWVGRLPYPDTATAFEALSTRFPLEIMPGTNQGRFIDAKRNPFGFLTQTGIEQLRETGHRFFNRYNHHGHHLPDRLEWRWEVAQDFLSVWDVNVYSTNYLRTILSAQSFLDGLLGASCYAPNRHRTYNPNVFNEPRVPDHSWARSAASDTSNHLVKVRVRDVSNDPLNAFDRNPELVNELVMEVMESDEFARRDGAAAPLAARLANVLPGLVRPHRTDFSKRAPSGINWVEAADHFVCRSAHHLDFAKFSDFEHDDRVEQTLTAMFHPTLAHLAWRFRQWYQNKRLLAAIAAPPLREIADRMTATPALGVGDKRPFTVYSCHDVTILGLLYGIGADFLADDNSSSWRWWPKYGSQLVFELVRMHKGVNMEDSYLVRVLLNGKPVLSVQHDHEKKDGRSYPPLGTGPKQLLRVEDFLNVVSALETAGGHDYDQLLGRK